MVFNSLPVPSDSCRTYLPLLPTFDQSDLISSIAYIYLLFSWNSCFSKLLFTVDNRIVQHHIQTFDIFLPRRSCSRCSCSVSVRRSPPESVLKSERPTSPKYTLYGPLHNSYIGRDFKGATCHLSRDKCTRLVAGMTLLDSTSSIVSYGTVSDEHPMGDQEEDRLLYPHSVYEPDTDISTEDEESTGRSVQDGVRKIKAISLTWTQRSLTIAYLG